MPRLQLKALKGVHSGRLVDLREGRLVVGREEGCHLRAASDLVSRRHCALSVSGEDVTIRDLGSSNGTFVNEQPVEGAVRLEPGDVITIGGLWFEFVVDGELAAARPEGSPRTPSPGR